MSLNEITVREIQEADHLVWNDFVGTNAHGDVMQSWEWGLVKQAGGDWTPIRLGAFSKGVLRGGIAILKRSIPLIASFYYAPRGPLLADWTDHDTLEALLTATRKRALSDNALFLKIDPSIPVDQPGCTLLRSFGFRAPAGFDAQGFGGTQPRTVMVLNLDDRTLDELLMACKPQCRRNVRISEKKAVEVITETTRQDLSTFYDLLKVTAERDGFRVRAFAYYETLWDQLAEKGLGKLFLTRYQGEYLSGAFCFVIGNKCVYVYGASSNEHRNIMPNYGMQWAMITWAKQNGCSIYDFRGVSPRRRQEGEAASEIEKEDHLQGLNRFKEGFGARYVEYIGELDLVYNRAGYWLWTRAKPMAQRMMRRVKTAN